MNKIISFSSLFLFLIICTVTESYARVRPPLIRPPILQPRPPPVRPTPPPFSANEPPLVAMSDPTYNGTGCPVGTVVSVLSPDQQVISILFNEFITQAGPGTGIRGDIKSCQIHIPLQIVNGSYQIMITQVDFRGLASLPLGANMHATGTYSITSPDYPNIRPQSFSTKTNTIVGPVMDEYFFSVIPIEGQGSGRIMDGSRFDTKWSACSNRLNLGIFSRLVLQNQNMQADALASVDSIDTTVTPGIEYQIKWRRCR